MTTPAPLRALALWVGVMVMAAASLGFNIVKGLTVETDIRALLPDSDERPAEVARWAQRVQQQSLSRTVMIIGHTDFSVAASASLAAREVFRRTDVRSSGEMEDESFGAQQWMGPGPVFMGGGNVAREASPLLLSAEDRLRLGAWEDEDWEQAAQRRLLSLADLASQTGFRDDPFGLTDRFLRAARPNTGFAPRGDCLHRKAEGRHWCLLLLQARDAGFGLPELAAQRALLDRAQAAAHARAPDAVVLDAGVSRHADYAARASKAEMGRISVVSVAAVAVLLFTVLQSVWPLLWVLSTLGAGALAGLGAALLLFDRLHLVALVFGVTLVGVAVDYAFHFLLARGDPAQRWARVAGGTRLALLTTALAFGSLIITNIPALMQVAVIAVAGLSASALTVGVWFPRLPAARLGRPRRQLVEVTARLLDFTGRSPRTLALAMTVLMAILGVVAVTQSQFGENVRALHRVDESLLARDAKARQLVGGPDASAFLLVHASTAEPALRAAEALAHALDTARGDGLLDEWMAPQPALVSTRRQEENRRQLLATVLRDGGPLTKIQQRWGLSADWANEQRAAVREAPRVNAPQSSDDLPPAWRGWWEVDAAGATMLVRMGGLADATELRARIDALSTGEAGVFWVDSVAEAERALEKTRIAATRVLVLAGWLVLAGMVWRFGPMIALRLFAPSILAGLSVLAALALSGAVFGLFHLLGLLLVIGMSVDYAVYLHEAAGRATRSVIASAASALTTLVAFGMLGLSGTPALAAMGGVVALGVSVAWLGAVLLREPPRSGAAVDPAEPLA